MLSILIPTYNYNAFNLAEAIEKQALALNLVFEIICRDDGSFSEENTHNQNIKSLTHSNFIEGKLNLGSIGNRLALADEAQYNWLLFIDADTLPKSDSFLKDYLNVIDTIHEGYFGGFAYNEAHKSATHSLRYHFGKKREEIEADQRNKKPYKVTISSNFLIQKDVFKRLLKPIDSKTYGLDYLFSILLKEQNIKILHLDNEVFHLGIDSNEDYLIKVRNAVETLHQIHRNKKIRTHDISLLRAYTFLKNLGLKTLFKRIFNSYKVKIERNLLGKSPNLFLLDIYKLGYMCSL